MEPNWNYINSKKRDEEENKHSDFSMQMYEIKKEKKRKTNLEFECREKIAYLLGRTIGQVCGLTKGWTLRDLTGCYTDAVAFTANPAARCWNIIREIKLKKNILKEIKPK